LAKLQALPDQFRQVFPPFADGMGTERHQELSELGQRFASRYLEKVQLLQDPYAPVLVRAKRLDLEQHGRKRLGDAVMQLPSQHPTHLVSRDLGVWGRRPVGTGSAPASRHLT
jgi:hypothetical protein